MPLVEWLQTNEPVAYLHALNIMEERVASIHNVHAKELVWLLEHPSLYTAGTSADPCEIIDATTFPIYQSGRGGRFTYHGPGQRIAYVMINLADRQKDLRAFIYALEQWIIDTLAMLGIKGERRQGRVGIWIKTNNGEEKIAAIGVRIRHWISFHGIAINVNPNLDHFSAIVPCGLSNFGVTSLKELGLTINLQEFDILLKKAWHQNVFLAS